MSFCLKELGRSLSRIRKEKGLTQAQIAKKLGISRDRWSRIERGVVDPWISELYKFSRIVKVPMDIMLE